MVAQGGGRHTLSIEEFVDDHTVAHEFAGLDSTLEVITSIQIEHIGLPILLSDDVNQGGHRRQPTIIVFLLSVGTEEVSGVSSSMNIVRADNHESLLVEGLAGRPSVAVHVHPVAAGGEEEGEN